MADFDDEAEEVAQPLPAGVPRMPKRTEARKCWGDKSDGSRCEKPVKTPFCSNHVEDWHRMLPAHREATINWFRDSPVEALDVSVNDRSYADWKLTKACV